MSRRPNHNPDDDDPNFYDKWIAQHLGYFPTDENAYEGDEREAATNEVDEEVTAGMRKVEPEMPNRNPRDVGPPIRPRTFEPQSTVDRTSNQLLQHLTTSMTRVNRDIINDRGFQRCNCNTPAGRRKCIDDNCILRQRRVECSESCGVNCQNRRVQKQSFLRCLHVESRVGWFDCLVTSGVIPKGTLIIEYVGLVRPGRIALNQPYAYPILKYGAKHDMYMDSSKRGNESRFIQHSTTPNSQIQEWIVDGRVRLLVFAIEYIPPAKVITIEYPQRVYEKAYPVTDEGERTVEEISLEQSYSHKNQPKHQSGSTDWQRSHLKRNKEGRLACTFSKQCTETFIDAQEFMEHFARSHSAALPEFCSSPGAPFLHLDDRHPDVLESYKDLHGDLGGNQDMDYRRKLCETRTARNEEEDERIGEERRVERLQQRREEAARRAADINQIRQETSRQESSGTRKRQNSAPRKTSAKPKTPDEGQAQGSMQDRRVRAMQQQQQQEKSSSSTAAQRRAIGERIQRQVNPQKKNDDIDSD